MKMARTTASPASFSPRALRSRNAIPSGIAVSASPKLWIRSASSATDLESDEDRGWAAAVTARIARLIDGPDAGAGAHDRAVDESVGVPVPVAIVLVVVAVRARVVVGVRGVVAQDASSIRSG